MNCLTMSLTSVGRSAASSGRMKPALNNETLLAREGHVLVIELAKSELVCEKLARVTNC